MESSRRRPAIVVLTPSTRRSDRAGVRGIVSNASSGHTELMRVMRDWKQEHDRIVRQMHRIQAIMNQEFAPGMPLHTFRVP